MSSLSDAEMMARISTANETLLALKADYDESLDTIWMLLASMLIFFMHAGFSMLEAGSVRFKNTQNILAKNLVVVTVGFLCWYVLGFTLALSETDSPSRFAGFTNFFMSGFLADRTKFRTWLFQGTFCATGATIVSGAMAERAQLKGFTIFTIFLTTIIYPVVVYWGWSGHGIFNYDSKSIAGPALIDFAGSGIVHMVGGIGALFGAVIVGARKDRFDPEFSAEFEGHNVPFCVLGTFFLWFGWYGFNAGSTGAMKTTDDAYTAGIVAVNTTLAPAIAGLTVFLLRAKVVQPRLLDVGGFCNGILAGLVSITAGCAAVKHWEALVMGFIGAFVYQGTSMLMKLLKVDDVVDAFAVHGACGMWGVLSLGFFGDPDIGGNGLFYGGDQIGIQVVAVIIITLWVSAWSLALFVPLRVLGMLRMGDDMQDTGADAAEHSPSKAYSGSPVTLKAPDSEKIMVKPFSMSAVLPVRFSPRSS